MHFQGMFIVIALCVVAFSVNTGLDKINKSIQQCNKQAPTKVLPPTNKRMM